MIAGLGIRLYTDEMIDLVLARILAGQGYDVETTPGTGRASQNIDDERQLEYATQQGRAILTFNTRDFVRIDRQWKAGGRRHAGIIVSVQLNNMHVLASRVRNHLDSVSPAVQHDVLLDLSA